MEVVSMPQALRVHPIEIDDSRLNALWTRQNRKGLWLAAAAGALAVLVGAALVVMAFRLNAQPPTVNVAAPIVNVPEQKPPVVNITMPEQKPPVVNVTVPPPVVAAQQAQQAPSTTTGGNKIVTKHTVFHHVVVGSIPMYTGWNYRSSNDTAPYTQYCRAHIGRTGALILADDGKISPDLASDARALGISHSEALTLAKNCVWTN